MPRAHDDAFLPLPTQLRNDRHPPPRHRPPTHALPDDREIIAQQPARRLPQHGDAVGIDGALAGDRGQGVGARVEAGEVDAAVGHAGEDLGAVVGVGVGGEDGVAVGAARGGGVGAVEGGGRPVRRAEDQRVAGERCDGDSGRRVGEEGAVDFGGPGSRCEDEAGTWEGCCFLGGGVEDGDAG